MFLRKNRKSFDRQVYEYWTLCQTVRTERGPRQQVVACLGKLSDEDLQAGWEDIEALLDGRAPSPRQPQLFASAHQRGVPEERWELGDLGRLSVARARVWRGVPRARVAAKTGPARVAG
jgi:hypothetical protein